MTSQTFLGLVTACEYEAVLVHRRMRLRHRQTTAVGRLWQGSLCGHDVVLLRCGMGPERAAQATTWLVQSYPLCGVISVGFAGGLQGSLDTGDAVLAQQMLSCNPDPTAPLTLSRAIKPDVRWSHIATTAALQAALVRHCGTLLSVAEVVPYAAAKTRLGHDAGALAVDMESYSVGQVAAEYNLPFVVLRTIFDTCDDDFPLQASRFTTPDGALQPGRLVCYLVHQPRVLTQMLPLWCKARKAGKHLETWLHHFLTLLRLDGEGTRHQANLNNVSRSLYD